MEYEDFEHGMSVVSFPGKNSKGRLHVVINTEYNRKGYFYTTFSFNEKRVVELIECLKDLNETREELVQLHEFATTIIFQNTFNAIRARFASSEWELSCNPNEQEVQLSLSSNKLEFKVIGECNTDCITSTMVATEDPEEKQKHINELVEILEELCKSPYIPTLMQKVLKGTLGLRDELTQTLNKF